MVHRQRQDSVIDKHGHTEFNKICDDIDILPGNEQDKAGQDQVQESRCQHNQQGKQPLFFFYVLADVAGYAGDDQIRQQVDAKEIAKDDILGKSA